MLCYTSLSGLLAPLGAGLGLGRSGKFLANLGVLWRSGAVWGALGRSGTFWGALGRSETL